MDVVLPELVAKQFAEPIRSSDRKENRDVPQKRPLHESPQKNQADSDRPSASAKKNEKKEEESVAPLQEIRRCGLYGSI